MAEMENSTNTVNKTKLNKILEMRLDTDKEVLEALADLSTFFKENTLKNRQKLRTEIEKEDIKINKSFLVAFQKVITCFDSVCNDIDNIATSVNTMHNNLKNSQALTKDLIKETNCLQADKSKIKIQHEIADAFVKRFQLNLLEHQTLYGTSRDSAITSDFFLVLDRVQSIHNDCKILMQSGYQTIALDIMEEMSLHQEAALEHLYRWTQHHCRNLESQRVNDLIVQAMNRLQHRPILFKYVIDEYVTSRRSIFVHNFIDALTTGGSLNNSKPIEIHSNEPKRYIGDMFAWLHQNIPTEKENLLLLLKMCEKNDIAEQIQLALANIIDGVCPPLKVRVETILNTEKDTIVLFAISNLLRFYQNIINQVVKGGGLEECMQNLQKYSEQIYLDSIAKQVKHYLQRPTTQLIGLELPQRDLLPSQNVNKILNFLKEILSVASMVDGRQADIENIVSYVIDPLMQSITESASHLPAIDMAVYMLNCLYQIQSSLAMFEYMDKRIECIQAQTDAQIDTLTSEQASSLVNNLNLGPIYTILQSNQQKFDINLLKNFISKLDAFLEMPEVLLLPQINLLISTTHRSTTQKRSFNVISAIYKQIYTRVHSPESGFENIDIFTKTPEEVSKILS